MDPCCFGAIINVVLDIHRCAAWLRLAACTLVLLSQRKPRSIVCLPNPPSLVPSQNVRVKRFTLLRLRPIPRRDVDSQRSALPAAKKSFLKQWTRRWNNNTETVASSCMFGRWSDGAWRDNKYAIFSDGRCFAQGPLRACATSLGDASF